MEENNENVEVKDQRKSNQLFIIMGAAGVVILIAAVVLVKGSGGSKDVDNMSMDNMQTDTPSDASALGASTSANVTRDPNAQEVKLEAGSYYYKPNIITAKKGQKVQVVMHSVSMMHNFNIDELDVHGPMIKNGDTQTIEFTPDKTGTFEYYCSVGQHRKLGQVGKIVVIE